MCKTLCTFAPNDCAMAYKIEDMEHPVYCLNCGGEIPSGRPDKKFCCNACKNRWHNRKKHQHREVVEQRVLRILERNHAILDRLERLGVHSVDRLTLVGLGYNLEYVTSYRKSGVHHQYACFDIHYEQTPTRIKKIVRTTIKSNADEGNV